MIGCGVFSANHLKDNGKRIASPQEIEPFSILPLDSTSGAVLSAQTLCIVPFGFPLVQPANAHFDLSQCARLFFCYPKV
jgi:hypothetical protein